MVVAVVKWGCVGISWSGNCTPVIDIVGQLSYKAFLSLQIRSFERGNTLVLRHISSSENNVCTSTVVLDAPSVKQDRKSGPQFEGSCGLYKAMRRPHVWIQVIMGRGDTEAGRSLRYRHNTTLRRFSLNVCLVESSTDNFRADGQMICYIPPL